MVPTNRSHLVLCLVVFLGLSTLPAWGRWDVETLTLIDLARDNEQLERESGEFVSAWRGRAARLDDVVYVMRLHLLEAKAQQRELEAMPAPPDGHWRKNLLASSLNLSVAHHAAICQALECRRQGRKAAEEKAWKTSHRVAEKWRKLTFAGESRSCDNWLRRLSPSRSRVALVGLRRVEPTSGVYGPLVAIGHQGQTLWSGPLSKNPNDPSCFNQYDDGDGCVIDLVGAFGAPGIVTMVAHVFRVCHGGPGGVSTIRWFEWSGRAFTVVHDAVLLESPAGSGRLLWADEWTAKERARPNLRRYILDRPGLYTFDRHYSDGSFLVMLVGLERRTARAIVTPDRRGFRLVRWVIPWAKTR